jgi:glycosyltransferase involved in cell wall biosynthesis
MSLRRVLLVSSGFPPLAQWGSDYYAEQLARGLRGLGRAVAVIHPTLDTALAPGAISEREQDGVRVFVINNPPRVRKRLVDSYDNKVVEHAFAQVLDRFRPDIVHCVHLMWTLSARLPAMCRERGVASVLTLTDFGLLCHRGQMFDWQLRDCEGPHPAPICARCIREPSAWDGSPLEVAAKRVAVRALAGLGGAGLVVMTRDVERRERVVRESLFALDRFIAPTRAIAEVFERAGIAAQRIELVPYGLDLAAFAQARAQAPRAAVRLGFIGQFAPHKGLHVLLDAIEIMEHRLPESVEAWQLQVFGERVGGRHRAYAERVLGRLTSPRVQVSPRFASSEIGAVLGQLDVVVVPSLWRENAPFAALQARASGVLVIASDVRGVREIVEPGVDGVLVPPGDARALADALRDVILRRVRRSVNALPPPAMSEHIHAVDALHERVVAGAGARR